MKQLTEQQVNEIALAANKDQRDLVQRVPRSQGKLFYGPRDY